MNDAVVQHFDLHGVRQANIHVTREQVTFKDQFGDHMIQNNIQMLQEVKAFSTSLRETTDAENNNQNNLCVSHSLH